ncbi:MAG: S41 family peptidase, partial [Planctomycetota bacterium]|nr:S41 family peptidase [Planctomycetota bacterium]
LRDVEGKPAGVTVQDVRHAAWRTETVRLRVPAGVGAVDVALFLSQTGRLEVRDVELRESKAEDSIDILIRAMDRHYSFFAAHEIDWRQEAHRHRRAAEAAKTPAAFITAIKPLLAKLKDGHVWIQAPDGRKTYTWTPQVEMNFDLQYLLGHLQDVQQVIRNVLSATTPEGHGYLALGTMQGTPTQYAAVERAFRAHFDKPGIVLDLRVNGGGQEVWGQRLCALLAKERTLYGRAQVRSGPKHTDLQPGGERHVLPAKSGRYAGPVVALIGPGCVSSGEGMAMMLKALPDIPLVGLPTRGSSGNPQPVHLPNGVTVWFSRWISQLPDGTPIERQGVPPDVRVEHARGKDPALAEAVKILKAKAEKR